jgi:hypothetical protein
LISKKPRGVFAKTQGRAGQHGPGPCGPAVRGAGVAVHGGPRPGRGERRGWAAAARHGRGRELAGAPFCGAGRHADIVGEVRAGQRGRCARRWRLGVAGVCGPRGGAMRRRRLTPVRPYAWQRGGKGPPSARARSSREGGARGMLTSGRTEAAERVRRRRDRGDFGGGAASSELRLGFREGARAGAAAFK